MHKCASGYLNLTIYTLENAIQLVNEIQALLTETFTTETQAGAKMNSYVEGDEIMLPEDDDVNCFVVHDTLTARQNRGMFCSKEGKIRYTHRSC